MPRPGFWILGPLFFALLVACGQSETPPAAGSEAAGSAEPAAPQVREYTAVPSEADWLEQRAAAQRAASADWEVAHGFGFRDGIDESGIEWRNEVVDDAGKAYKAVHYDHGNGVSAADVDGDGDFDLYFTNQAGNNALYTNNGDGTFSEASWDAGVPVFDRVSVAASFADIDNDGDPDLYVTSVREGNLLFANDGSGAFTDITAESGLGYEGHSSGAVFFDYDRDGLLDLYLANVGVYTTDKQGDDYWIGFPDAFHGHLKPERFESSRLYRNLGDNRFEDVTEAMGLEDARWTGDASPIDANGDGWLDLYVLNMQGLDGYYENQAGKKFVDRTDEVFPRSSWGAMGIQVFDWDNDGDEDIYITDMHSDMWEGITAGSPMHEWHGVPPKPEDEKRLLPEPMEPHLDFTLDEGRGIWGNSFFRNEGDGHFSEVAQEIGAENYWPWGLSSGDLNADGFEDVFIASSMSYPFRYATNSLLLNDGGKRFLDAEFVLGVEPRQGGATVTDWFELDCGGDDRYHPHCREQEGFEGILKVSGALGTRSSVLLDLDDDGDLDIVTSEFGAAPQVLVSDLAQQGEVRFLKVEPEGSRSNRDGIGARVTVKLGDREISRVRLGRSGYLSGSLLPIYFGLGEAEQVDSVTVVWPSGAEQTVEGPIEANQTLVVKEPEAS